MFRVPILLAYSFCNHLPENLVAEANLEVLSFSYRVAAHKAEDVQANCWLGSAFEFHDIRHVVGPLQMLVQISLHHWAVSQGEKWKCCLLG